MITANQLRASRGLLGIGQKELADAVGLSVQTIQRMESSDGVIRGNVDSLTKLIVGLEAMGIELIGENLASQGLGRGVRLLTPEAADTMADENSPAAHVDGERR